MTISFNPGVSPDDYAKTYATQNNMSVDDAKAELKSKYGDPKRPDESNSIFAGTSFGSTESAANDYANLSPEDYATKYAEENSLSIDEAIKELEEKLGVPEEKSGIGNAVMGAINTVGSAISNFVSGLTRPDPGVDPDTYAQEYADANGLSLDDAKTELKNKFGEPEQPDKNQQETENDDMPPFVQGMNPDYYVRAYANENNLTFDEAKAELETKYGVFGNIE